VVAKLRDEYVAGRLSHETFMHRVNQVLVTRQQADLPPFVADLPAGRRSGGLVGWLRGTWSRVTGTVAPAAEAGRDTGPEAVPPARSPLRAVTTRTSVSPAHREPFALQFPRTAGDRFTIGRDASCDLAIADMSVSRQHAQLERTPDGWLLSDLESTNGTRVNGWRVRGLVPVKVGDLVSFGNLEVIFTRSDQPA
jgi:pSer/pThr/pTyr-binding forkhead associated (FHA) protein